MKSMLKSCIFIFIFLLHTIAYCDPIPPNTTLQGQDAIKATISKIFPNIDTSQLSVNWNQNNDGSITANIQYKNNNAILQLTPEEINAASTGVLLPITKEKILQAISSLGLIGGALQ